MDPNKIDTIETTFATKLLDSNGTQHFLTNRIKLSDGFEIKQIRPKFSTYYYNMPTEKKAICLHFTVGNIKGDIGSLTKDGNKVSVNYVVDRQGNIYNLFDDKYWSYHLGANTIGSNATMSKQTIGIEISNYGPLKLTADGALLDSYGNLYCTLEDKDYYKECDYRGYNYYATMTEKQEMAVAKLLNYLCEENNIPKEFKENPDVVFKDATSAKAFTGIYLHTSVRKDKYDWPEPMINGIKTKFKGKKLEAKKDITNQTTTVIIENKNSNIETFVTVENPSDDNINSDIQNTNVLTQTIAVEKPKNILDIIIDFILSLLGKKK